jgi:hypothetical protein
MTQTLSKTMKAVAIDRFGGIETLKTHVAARLSEQRHRW